jgi:putative membrane protein
MFAMLVLVTAMAVGCKKESTTSTDSATTAQSTDTVRTDTSATQSSTMGTSGTDTAATGTTSTTSTGATGGTVSALSEDDKKFMTKAAQGGMAEVQGGQTAASQATNADVKTFGQQMVTDHSAANGQLMQLATTKGMALPTETDAEHKKKLSELSKKTGAAFDKAYMADMVEDHEKDVKEFEKESKDGKDPDLKAWAAKTLPTLQHHLQMAKATNAKVK